MKRNDLQAIRGIAILLVLVFHLQPHLFPLGFIGVDMFFVLSGFLMTTILSKATFSFSMLWDFYTRRFKRIVPLMYIILTGVYIGCAFLIFGIDKEQLKKDLVWSLSFVSNIQPLFEVLGYWDQVVSFRFLVHCWSLGVEIQFYLFAPYIIKGTNLFSPVKRKCALLILIACSLSFQLFSPPKISYGFLPSRIWQFLMGALCHEPSYVGYEVLVDEKDSQKEKEEKKTSLINRLGEPLQVLVCVVVLLNWNKMFTETIMRLNTRDRLILFRIFGTTVCAFMIAFPMAPNKSLLSNRVLVYIGDISYVAYLIHWPMIIATKYIVDEKPLAPITACYLFVVILLSSVLLHHTLEKSLLKASLLSGVVIVVSCSLFLFFSFPYYDGCCNIRRYKSIGNINVTEAIEWNEFENTRVYFDLPCDRDNITEKWTGFKQEPIVRCQTYGNGTANILVIGNSMSSRAFPLVHKVLRGRYKELRIYSRGSRPPLLNVDPVFTRATHIVVDKLRPDILWNMHVIRGKYRAPFNEAEKEKDSAYQEIVENLNYYKERVKLFIIDLPFFWYDGYHVAYELAKRLRQGKPVDDMKIPEKDVERQERYARQRIVAAPCANCMYVDVESRMIEDGYYWLFNRKNYHSYTKEGLHFTWEMLNRLEPLYQKVVDDALKRIGAE